jgi:hypothetical protein
VWLIVLQAFCYGALSSTQYTSMNTLTYADVTSGKASAASSIASTLQQLDQIRHGGGGPFHHGLRAGGRAVLTARDDCGPALRLPHSRAFHRGFGSRVQPPQHDAGLVILETRTIPEVG